MEYIWKVLSIGFLLQVSLIIYFTVWTPFITNHQNIELVKKNLFTENTKTRNVTNPGGKHYEHENRTESEFVRLSVNRSIENSHNLHTKFVMKNKGTRVTRTKIQLEPTNSLTFGTKKRVQKSRFDINHNERMVAAKTTHSKDKSYVSAENKTTCTYHFETYELVNARKVLSGPNSIYLYYINIDAGDIFKKFNFSKTNLDDLLHWQYVLKEEKFLVQLPVDIDLITFFLLSADKEEIVLDLKLLSNSNCNANFTEVQKNIRLLLWNELFRNNSKFYLCNRRYENSPFREVQYFITTIWVGYDLECTDWHGEEPFSLQKDSLPLVTPLFCFLLSFHFVWIFIILDMNRKNQQNSTIYYRRNDKPFGIKRFSIKVLNGKFSNCCKSKCCIPSKRLIFLLWLFILLPFGLYRTIVRHVISSNIYKNFAVLRPSEPFFSFIDDDTVAFRVDVVYASLFPIIFICIGGNSFKKYKKDNGPLDCQSQMSGGNETNFIETLTSPCYRVCTVIYSCLKNDCCCSCSYGENYKCKCEVKLCCECEERECCICLCKSNECNSSCCSTSYFWKYVLFPFHLTCCIIPIFPFIFSYVSCDCSNNIKKCKSCCGCSERCKTECTTLSKCCDILIDCCNLSCKCSNCCCDCCDSWSCKCFFRGIGIVLILLLSFLFSFVIYLRPIISTFTFLIRSFTYFFFVALPIREHLMRYALIAVSTIGYFSKYLQEVINMNQEILNYIFDQQITPIARNSQNEENHISANEQKVTEIMFNYIYANLKFVKKRFYFLFLKTLIIFIYLFITIETFITNKKSGSNLQSMVEVLLLIIGPYAISLFLKVSKENFLTDENKREIRCAYDEFKKSHSHEQEENLSQSTQDTENGSCCCSYNCKFCDEDFESLFTIPTNTNYYERIV